MLFVQFLLLVCKKSVTSSVYSWRGNNTISAKFRDWSLNNNLLPHLPVWLPPILNPTQSVVEDGALLQMGKHLVNPIIFLFTLYLFFTHQAFQSPPYVLLPLPGVDARCHIGY